MLYAFPYMSYLECQVHRHKIELWWAGTWGRRNEKLLFNGYRVSILQAGNFWAVWGGMNRQSTEDLGYSENTLQDTILIDTWYICPKPIDRTTPRVNSDVNYRLWVSMYVSIGSSIVTNTALCWGMLPTREALYVWGQVCGDSFIFLWVLPPTQSCSSKLS